MYTWIWHHLPGPTSARAVSALLLLAVVVGALFAWVFPWVEAQLPYSEVTVPGPGATSGTEP